MDFRSQRLPKPACPCIRRLLVPRGKAAVVLPQRKRRTRPTSFQTAQIKGCGLVDVGSGAQRRIGSLSLQGFVLRFPELNHSIHFFNYGMADPQASIHQLATTECISSSEYRQTQSAIADLEDPNGLGWTICITQNKTQLH